MEDVICETEEYRIVKKEKGCFLYVSDKAGGWWPVIQCGSQAAAMKYYKAEFESGEEKPELIQK